MRFFATCLFMMQCLAIPVGVLAQFKDVTAELGFSGSGKAAFADFDNDGFVDLYSGQLWRNIDGKRLEVVPDSGVGGGQGIWGDFDNDGQLDLFVFTGAGALYRNLGDQGFEKMSFPKLPTVNSRGAVWIDINSDGLLDLYVGGYEVWQKAVHPDVAYLNRGDAVFEEIWRSPSNYSARGVTAGDYDNDGFVDVYVSNYRLQPNFLLKNNRKNGFDEIGEQSNTRGIPDGVIGYTGGIRYPVCGHTIGSCFSDLDNDGLLDLFVGNFSHPRPGQDHPQFLRNEGSENGYLFTDQSELAGLKWQESYASPTFGDFDNDGFLDLFFTTVYAVGSGSIRNYPVLYRGKGDWKFEDVTVSQKVNELPPTYQAAWADLDNDGDLDLCTAGRIFRNENAADGKWIKLKLQGDGTQTNHSGIGAVVRINVGNQVITRQVEGGTGEGNQNELTLHFGFGDLDADSITGEITWPGNHKQIIETLELNSLHHVVME